MITAIVLAAGESRRMGQPKMLMSWGKSTVLQTVISTIQAAGVTDVLVVTGGSHREVEALVGKTVQTVFNEEYAQGEMLSSIQTGLQAKMREAQAALICLGDQPQIQERSVRRVRDAYIKNHAPLVIPSFEKRRGHPWLVARPLWDELLAMQSPQTPRDFINAHSKEIEYVNVDTRSVIEDLDTPEDYLKFKA